MWLLAERERVEQVDGQQQARRRMEDEAEASLRKICKSYAGLEILPGVNGSHWRLGQIRKIIIFVYSHLLR